MTETSAHPIPQAGDPRFDFAHVIAQAGRLIETTDPGDLANPTACTDYDTETLIAHMVAILRRVAVVARGEDPFSVPQLAEKPDDGSWHDSWTAAAHEVQAEWADPAVLDRVLTLPFGEMPGGIALTIYCGEFAVHAWDLATATGRIAEFDDERIRPALEGAKFGLPAEGRGAEMPFDPVVAVPDDAPVVDQLAGWMGRAVA
jgi:uncharacterized protein (TIGR03086 family)